MVNKNNLLIRLSNKNKLFLSLLYIIAFELFTCTIQAQPATYSQQPFAVNIPYNTSLPNRRITTADWMQTKLKGTSGNPNSFEWVNAGTFPTATNSDVAGFASGAGFVCAVNRSVSLPGLSGAANGDAAILISKALDFSGHITYDALKDTIGISIWRDNTAAALTIADSLKVYINSQPDLAGATLLEVASVNGYTIGAGTKVINRSASLSPAAFIIINDWNRYTFSIPNLPAYVSGTGGKSSTYILVAVYSAGGNNIYLDNWNMPEWPTNMVIESANVTYQESADLGKNTSNNLLLGVKITTKGSLSPLKLDGIAFTTSGSTNFSNDAQNPIAYYTGGWPNFSYTPATGAVVIPTNATQIPNALGVLNFGWYQAGCNPPTTPASMTLNPGADNYVWLSCDIKPGPPAITNNNVGAVFQFAIARPAGICTYYGNAISSTNLLTTPIAPQTLGFARVIDQGYILPSYTAGTSFGAYNNNDFISAVNMTGENATALNNYEHDLTCLPCLSTAGQPAYCSRLSCHPPDYTYFKPENLSTYKNRNIQVKLGYGKRGLGAAYQLKAQAGAWPYNNNSIAVFIDWNRDGDFDDYYNGPGGIIYESYGTQQMNKGDLDNYPVAAWPVNTSWIVDVPDKTDLVLDLNDPTQLPNNTNGPVFTGNVRMRIREVFGATAIHPFSANYTYGEIEDYSIQVLDNCPALSNNVCKWIGTTADWNNNTNWCPKKPTANDIAYIGPVSNSFYAPTIGDSTNAVCRVMQIADGGFLKVDAPLGGSSLKVTDDITIGYNAPAGSNAGILINSKYENTVTVPGVSSTPPAGIAVIAVTPFKINAQSKLQVAYTKNELSRTFGLKAGDVIDTLFTLSRDVLSPIAPFQATLQNFKITAYFTSVPVVYTFPTPPAGTKMAVDANDPFVNNTAVIFGPTNLTLYATSGSNGVAPGNLDTFALISNSLVWDGVSNLVLSFEYNTASGAAPAKQFVLYDESNPAFNTLSITNDGIGNIITGWNIAGPNTYFDGSAYVIPVPATGANAITASASKLRPRINFKYHRSYKSFDIIVGGDWVNNNKNIRTTAYGITPVYNIAGDSGFVAGFSKVLFDSTGRGLVNSPGLNSADATYYFGIPGATLAADADQEISSGNIASTVFNYIEINKPTLKVVRQNSGLPSTTGAFADSINLAKGTFVLNRKTFNVMSGANTAVKQTTGYFISEDNFGGTSGTMESIVNWNIGSASGLFKIPFGNSTATFNLSYTNTVGDNIGILGAATYGTPGNNIPYPFPALPGTSTLHVSTMTTNTFSNATPWAVDRFWYIKRSSTSSISPTTLLRFEYPSSEASLSAGYTAGEMKAQRYGNTGGFYNAWDQPYAGQLDGNLGVKQFVQLPGNFIDVQNNIWTIVRTNTFQSPLPLQLISFDAKQVDTKVKLWWTVMSESDVTKYAVRRTTNQNDYLQVATKLPVGPSTALLNYEAVDNQPLNGLQYYQLTTALNDGSISYSNLVPIRYNAAGVFDIISVTANGSASIKIDFTYNSNLPYTCVITDMMGRVLSSGTQINVVMGENSIVLPAALSRGLYNISLMNAEKVVTKKLFF